MVVSLWPQKWDQWYSPPLAIPIESMRMKSWEISPHMRWFHREEPSSKMQVRTHHSRTLKNWTWLSRILAMASPWDLTLISLSLDCSWKNGSMTDAHIVTNLQKKGLPATAANTLKKPFHTSSWVSSSPMPMDPFIVQPTTNNRKKYSGTRKVWYTSWWNLTKNNWRTLSKITFSSSSS